MCAYVCTNYTFGKNESHTERERERERYIYIYTHVFYTIHDADF